MSINDYVTEFNANIDQLLSELELISKKLITDGLITNDPITHLNYYMNLCKTSRVLNQEILIESMSTYILKNEEFVKRISLKDKEYFNNFDFTTKTKRTNILELITCIRNIFNVLSSENQEIIFEYLQVLCTISFEYIKLKY